MAPILHLQDDVEDNVEDDVEDNVEDDVEDNVEDDVEENDDEKVDGNRFLALDDHADDDHVSGSEKYSFEKMRNTVLRT